MKKIITKNNLPTNYDIVDQDKEKICTCRPLTMKLKNTIQFKTISTAYDQLSGLLTNKIDINLLYDYILSAVIDWLYYDLDENKIPFNKLNIYKYIDISMLIYISNQIVLKLKSFVDLNLKN